jgi:hypothetical protein
MPPKGKKSFFHNRKAATSFADDIMKALILTLALCLSWQAQAHTLHQSTAEGEYNSKTKKLEVSLTVFIDDLELALIRQSEKWISFEKTAAAELDAQIQTYLNKNFQLMNVKVGSSKLTWVGRKVDTASVPKEDPEVTLFFELDLPEGFSGITLRYAILQDLFKDQINLLHLRGKAKPSEFLFTHDEAEKRLDDVH